MPALLNLLLIATSGYLFYNSQKLANQLNTTSQTILKQKDQVIKLEKQLKKQEEKADKIKEELDKTKSLLSLKPAVLKEVIVITTTPEPKKLGSTLSEQLKNCKDKEECERLKSLLEATAGKEEEYQRLKQEAEAKN